MILQSGTVSTEKCGMVRPKSPTTTITNDNAIIQ